MATLLFRLANVSEEEAWEVRGLLNERGFDTYETHAGFWRLGVDAIWLSDATQLEEARAVLEHYQAERRERIQQEDADQLDRGQAPTLWQRFSPHPGNVLLILLGDLTMLGLMLVPSL